MNIEIPWNASTCYLKYSYSDKEALHLFMQTGEDKRLTYKPIEHRACEVPFHILKFTDDTRLMAYLKSVQPQRQSPEQEIEEF